jgi:thiol-disulfide isomerase/thioredoxin
MTARLRNVPYDPRRRRVLLLVALGCAAACADPPTPSYTRLSGTAPALVGTSPGATLVVFWATWCPPCREEAGPLRDLARDPPVRLAVVTFAQEDSEGPIRSFFGGEPPTELAIRLDADRRAAAAFGVDVLPAAFLVVDGRLLARFDGPRDWESPAMRRLLARLATEPGRAPSGRASVDRDGRHR